MAGADFAATAFFAAFGAADFFATTGLAAGATGLAAGADFLAALFLTLMAFPVATEPALAVDLGALPPKIPTHPSEYFSLVPTRVIVTESPLLAKTEITYQTSDPTHPAKDSHLRQIPIG